MVCFRGESCSCCSVMVAPRKESWAVKVVVALSPGS